MFSFILKSIFRYGPIASQIIIRGIESPEPPRNAGKRAPMESAKRDRKYGSENAYYV